MKLYVPQSPFGQAITPHLQSAGISVSTELGADCDLALCPTEQDIPAQSIAAALGVRSQGVQLLDKVRLVELFSLVGFPTLAMHSINDPSDIASLSNVPLILKPAIGMGSKTANPLGYVIFDSPEQLRLAIETQCPDFWERQRAAGSDELLYAQESVAPSGEQALLTILEGFVNGAGEVVYLPIVENFQDGGQPTETDVAAMPVSEQEHLQEAMTTVLRGAGVRNAFFMMQFIRRAGGPCYPIDFQYRLSYHTAFAVTRLYPNLMQELLRFAFDLGAAPLANVHGHTRAITFNINSNKLYGLCNEYGVWPSVAQMVDTSHMLRVKQMGRMTFNTAANSKQEAKAKMDSFQAALEAL